MAHTERTLRHLPFFEALAELEESDAAWRSTSAGLVVLRLVDAWIEEGPEVITAGSWSVEAAREAVEAVGDGDPARPILVGILDALESSPHAQPSALVPRLMAYAGTLRIDGRYALAADVYHSILGHVHPLEEPDMAIEANMRLGFSLRQLGDLAGAAAGYTQAGRVATAVGDMVGVLRSRLGDAQIALVKGNLPHAGEILDETIGRATRAALPEIRALALHDRALIAHRGGDYERAVRLAYEALEITSTQQSRDRVLGDIAAAFLRLGVRSAARDAYLVLAATAVEQYVRWSSVMNLMEIAALDQREVIFEQYRRELADQHLPVEFRVNYHLIAGEGYAAFGQDELAREYLGTALELATKHQLNQLMFKAEDALKRLRSRKFRTPAAPEHEPAIAPEVSAVAAAVRGMRLTAGVTG